MTKTATSCWRRGFCSARGRPECRLAAGIGEHAVAICARVCRDAGWLGLELDEGANQSAGPRISTAASPVAAWVIPTNEELMIARHTRRLVRESASKR